MLIGRRSRPVAPIVGFGESPGGGSAGRGDRYGLSLSIITRTSWPHLQFAEQIPAGMVHINDQTITDEPIAPFGGMGLSGNGSRIGGLETNLDAFTEVQWVTAQARPAATPSEPSTCRVIGRTKGASAQHDKFGPAWPRPGPPPAITRHRLDRLGSPAVSTQPAWNPPRSPGNSTEP